MCSVSVAVESVARNMKTPVTERSRGGSDSNAAFVNCAMIEAKRPTAVRKPTAVARSCALNDSTESASIAAQACVNR